MSESVAVVNVMVARLAVGVQLGIVCLLALFFAALARKVKLHEVRLWTAAWACDALAIAAVFVDAFMLPTLPGGRAWLAAYVACKTAYALLLVAGTHRHIEPGVEVLLPRLPLFVAFVAWSAAVGFLTPRLIHAQIAQSLMVGGILCYGAVWVLRHPRLRRSRWLGWALLLQGLLFLHYVPLLVPMMLNGKALVPYLPYSSFLDAGGELLVALATMVALEATSTDRLTHLIQELEASQDRLRQLVDLDPLTKLSNRRGLRAEFQRVQPQGAAVIFLDIDNFKTVNDRFGHAVGDLCLVRVAAVLIRSFRAEDTLLRWGGDEFLILAPGMDYESARQRVDAFRAEMSHHGEGAPPVAVSVGIAMLPAGGEPDVALRESDQRMYADKRQATPRTQILGA